MISSRNNNIAAIILSGGQGARLGHIDKGLQTFKGKAMVAWVIDSIKPQVEKIIISINRNQKQYDEFQLPTLIDEYGGDFNGPIAGILSCVEQLRKQDFAYFLIASCDSPRLTKNYVTRLYDTLRKSDADVAVVNDGKRNQHLHSLIKTSAIEGLNDYFSNGGRSMHGWLKLVKLIEVDFSDLAECFININTPAELSDQEKKQT